MAERRFTLIAAERLAVTATVLVGWLSVVDQVIHDGFTSGGGTVWLGVFAAAATAGALVLFTAKDPCQHGYRAVGLTITALSPTVFVYILNAVVLAFAVTELVLTVLSKRQPRQLGSAR